VTSDRRRGTQDLILVDLVVAEVVYVLESVYAVERERVAELVRAIIGFRALAVPDEALLLRALELYEQYRIHFAESYLAACAELSAVGAPLSAVAHRDPSDDAVQLFDD
jgi:predicted nucleic-acid-binding protein